MNVMITGAAGGLGRAMAVECARRGYQLFLTDVNQQGLCAIKQGLERQFGATVTARACDLSSADSVDEMLREIDENQIRFDMLLNIAGLDFEGGFMKREREQVVQIAALNDVGTLRMTHAVLERRRADRPFTLVFVSSLASMFPMPLKATYAASKRFLLDFAISLRQELKRQNVNTLALCPGGMVTNEEVASAIAAQGVLGDMTTNALEKLVRRTLNRALHGRGIYIPGGFNHMLACLGKVVPRAWIAALLYRRWIRTQKLWLAEALCSERA